MARKPKLKIRTVVKAENQQKAKAISKAMAKAAVKAAKT